MSSPTLAILEELIAIESVNPALDPASPGEAAVADYVETRCRRLGLKTWRQEVFPGRENLLIELNAGHSQTLLFEAHMDTVLLGGMPDALKPTYRDGKLYGRGSCDTKGSLASMLSALEAAAADPHSLSSNIAFCCTVDEEHGARGINVLADSELGKFAAPVTGAVIGEPTDLEIIIAHKGCARFALATEGVAAHSSMPHKGDSAILQMYEVLKFMREEYDPLLASRDHPLCGAPTAVVGIIRGGTQINIVPERCEIEIDRRLIPGEQSRPAIEEFTELLGKAVEGRGVKFSVRDLLLDPPLNTDPNSELVQRAQAVSQKLQLKTELNGVPYGSDASKLQVCGIPAIVFGPGSITQAHTVHEFVPIDEVETATQYYGELMRAFGRA